MDALRRKLSFYSRSRSVLWKTALGIAALSIVVALLTSRIQEGADPSFRERIAERFHGEAEGRVQAESLSDAALDEFSDLVQDRTVSDWEVIEVVPVLAAVLRLEDRPKALARVADRFGQTTADLAADYLGATFSDDPEAVQRLERKAQSEPPTRYANRILAELALKENLPAQAAAHYAREGAFPKAAEERARAVELYRTLGAYTTLANLAADPRFEDAMSPLVKLDLAIQQRDWLAVAQYQWQHTVSNIHFAYTALALLGGCVWGVFLYQLGHLSGRGVSAAALALAAFVLGALSTLPTVYLDIVLVELYNFEKKGEVLHDIAINIASVGLREEFCKLLLFLPLAPILVRRGNQLEMLVIAGFVGLGFAVQENTSYFEMTAGVAGPARLLTANFFHIGMTALSGFYLCRWLGVRGYSFSDFFYVFGLVIIAHGVYDALLSVSQLGELSYFAYSVYIVLSLRFFAEAHELRSPGTATVSITATFTVGASLFIGAILVYLSWQIGLKQALTQMVPSLLGVGIIAVMFFREFREELYE